jgi:hypothetical protein
MAKDKSFFDVKRGDELIRIHIDGEFARLQVSGIDSVAIVIEALNAAVAAGARRGLMETGALLPDQSAAKGLMRASKGVSWLGGKVTFLGVLPDGPEFRVDWDQLPTITV